ncbi:MAG TPA: thioredoxin domain-containing protein [Ignavibacteriales bacterium]|nr:thioredoxin domain-containing protein [Ignavibacteriales bacterium]
MNRLQFETSPYLLQHKNNPVNWYAWGEEAFKEAKEKDKPIFLSIGYSACHWCHVMERESFENEEIAAYLNEHFISIKVDREERPDVDNIYMNYVQLITGSGGWPLSVFLTPDKLPFFGGTYFPPDDRYGRPGFPKLLALIYDAYKNQKDEIYSKKEEIRNSLIGMTALSSEENAFEFSDFDEAFNKIKDSYDQVWGGFGGAPKFPSFSILTFLLRYYSITKNEDALEMAELSIFHLWNSGQILRLFGHISLPRSFAAESFPPSQAHLHFS